MTHYEVDVEDAFIERAGRFGIEVLGRQVDLGIGIADVIGWADRPVVIEVKRGKATKNVASQLLGYMICLQSGIWNHIPALLFQTQQPVFHIGKVYGVIVAKQVDRITSRLLALQDNLAFIQYTHSPDTGFTFIPSPSQKAQIRERMAWSAETEALIQKIAERSEQQLVNTEESLEPRIYDN